MNTDELRTLLKEAGRPVDSPGDPVPVIRQRARRHRRNQAAAAVACTAVVAAGVVGAVGLPPRGSVEPAGPVVTEFPLQALGGTPPAVGNRRLLGDGSRYRETEAGGGIYLPLDELRRGDLVRIRTACPTATASDPVMLSVWLTPLSKQELDPPPAPPGPPVRGARQVSCTDSPTTTDFVVPAGWPWHAAVQLDMNRRNETRSVKLEVTTYR